MSTTNHRLALATVAAVCLLISGAASDAQSAKPSPDDLCHAVVSTKDFHVTQCPVASLHFHGSVSDCQDSKGTFLYEYTRVVPGRKETVQHTAAWIAHGKEWNVIEHMPASCDDEVDDTQVVRVLNCSCVKR